ncbi:MAG: hypothetical protein WCZ28_06130 [Burkholderiaceae bacterium]
MTAIEEAVLRQKPADTSDALELIEKLRSVTRIMEAELIGALQAYSRLGREKALYDVTATELILLGKLDQPRLQYEMRSGVDVDRYKLNRTLRDLARRGLVSRRPPHPSAHTYEVSLTDYGRRVLGRARYVANVVMRYVADESGLCNVDLHELEDLLKRITKGGQF